MTTAKKITLTLAVLFSVFSLCACGGKFVKPETDANGFKSRAFHIQ
jgi:hypothetical protein